MNRSILYILWLSMACISACRSGNKADQKATAAKSIKNHNDFIKKFSKLQLPYHITDTAIARRADTTRFPYATAVRFIPDTVLSALGMSGESVLQPMGSISKEEDTYLLAAINNKREIKLVALFFDSKDKYRGALPLISNKPEPGYEIVLDINAEPSFTSYRYKRVKNEPEMFTRTTYAYSESQKSFIAVTSETNERIDKNAVIQNPIDTLPATLTYSGEYRLSNRNFLSVRDGNNSTYQFFLHFEKDALCRAELKGLLRMTDAKTGVYQKSGDPCIIKFSFTGKNVQVKEEGNCGNYRGIKCLISERYLRKK